MKLLFAMLLTSATWADVTVRYSMSMEPGPALPPHAVEQMKSQMKEFLGSSTLQVKGNRARSAGMGCTSITDFDGATITLLNETEKQFATASQKQYLQAVKDVATKSGPDEEKNTESLQAETSAKKTDRTRVIRGIRAEETEVVFTMQMPGMPVRMRSAITLWSATSAEAGKHPAVAELAAYSRRAWEGTDLTATFKTMMTQTPGAGAGMLKLIESVKETGLLLEMNATVSMPGLAEMVRKLNPEAAAELAPGGDEVMMTMSQKLEELSSAEVPESLFVVPKDYMPVNLSEMIGQLMPGARKGTR